MVEEEEVMLTARERLLSLDDLIEARLSVDELMEARLSVDELMIARLSVDELMGEEVMEEGLTV